MYIYKIYMLYIWHLPLDVSKSAMEHHFRLVHTPKAPGKWRTALPGYPSGWSSCSLQIFFFFGGGMFFCSPEKSKVPMNVPSLFKMMLQQRFLSGKWCFNNGVYVQELHMIQGYPKHSKTTNRNVRVLQFGLQSTYMVVVYMYANVYAIYLYIHTL